MGILDLEKETTSITMKPESCLQLENHLRNVRVCLVASGDVLSFIGGISSFAESLIKLLIVDGADVSLIYRKSPYSIGHDNFSTSGSRITSVSSEAEPTTRADAKDVPYILYQLSLLFFGALAFFELTRANKRERLSILHSQDSVIRMYSGLASVLAGKLLRLPVIVHVHGDLIGEPENVTHIPTRTMPCPYLSKFLDDCVRGTVAKHATAFVAVSESTRKSLLECGFDRNRIHVIHPGLDRSKYVFSNTIRLDVRRTLRMNQDSFVVGFVGRFSPEKNLNSLVKAMAHFINSIKISNAFLLLVGDGSTRFDVLRLSTSLGIDKHIICVGARRDVEKLLQAMDVFVLVSFTEGFPISLLEAMAAGKAIIASNIPSIREIVRNTESAILLDPNDPQAIGNALRNLHGDRALARMIGNRAREESTSYSQDTCFKKIRDLYIDLLTAEIA